MIIRPYLKRDKEFCREILDAEGITEGHEYENSPTWILEDDLTIGFFTIVLDTFPKLQHFCIKGDLRTMVRARIMIKAVKQVLRDWGVGQFLINSPKEYLNKMIEYYFKTKPIFKNEKSKTYLLEV